MSTISKIPQHLTEKIKSFPQTPGIYQMKDKNYVYLKVEQYNKHRTLSVVRERIDEYCFGPYRHKNRVVE